MRPSVTVSCRSIRGLMLGCALLALACDKESGSVQPPAGTGGAAGTGGTSSGQPDAAAQGGAGAGGTTVSRGTGGASGVGGGSTSTGQGSGGAEATGGRTTRPGTGGRTASSGTGGRAAGGTSGAPSTGGVQAAGGAAAGGSTRPAGTGGVSAGGTTGASSAPVPSEGCGKTPPASGTYTIDVSGTAREYIIKLPDGYDAQHPYRLLLGFHGAKYDDKWVAEGGENLTGPYFGIESEAQGSTIFVAPQANPTWAEGDLAFVDAMVARFESQLCIDKSRIFAAGFSMGAIMTLRIGCNRSEVFRGIAPMSGSLPSPCPAGQHIAYWASHGTSDTTISTSQGQAARDEFVKRNHCGTQTSSPDANNCVTYSGCDQGYPVIWCTFSGDHRPAPFAGKGIWGFISPL